MLLCGCSCFAFFPLHKHGKWIFKLILSSHSGWCAAHHSRIGNSASDLGYLVSIQGFSKHKCRLKKYRLCSGLYISIFYSVHLHTACMCPIFILGFLLLLFICLTNVLEHHCNSSPNVCVISMPAQSCEPRCDEEQKLKRLIMNIVEKWWKKDFIVVSGCCCCASSEQQYYIFFWILIKLLPFNKKKILNISVVKFEWVILWTFTNVKKNLMYTALSLTKTIAIGKNVSHLEVQRRLRLLKIPRVRFSIQLNNIIH